MVSETGRLFSLEEAHKHFSHLRRWDLQYFDKSLKATLLANETSFANLGHTNASRSPHLPPSQGGRYQGFGNSPARTPSPSLSPPSFTSNTATLIEVPLQALSKTWSLRSSALSAVSTTIIQPGMEAVMDSALHASVRRYVDGAEQWSCEAPRIPTTSTSQCRTRR